MIDRSLIRSHRNEGRPKIERDPELQAFVEDLLPHCTFVEVAAACAERFGKQRAPGKSTVHRYWHRRKARIQGAST